MKEGPISIKTTEAGLTTIPFRVESGDILELDLTFHCYAVSWVIRTWDRLEQEFDESIRTIHFADSGRAHREASNHRECWIEHKGEVIYGKRIAVNMGREFINGDRQKENTL